MEGSDNSFDVISSIPHINLSNLPSQVIVAVDEVVAKLILLISTQDVERTKITVWLQALCSRSIQGQNFMIKSAAFNMCLPHESLEITTLLYKRQEPLWFTGLHEALCIFSCCNKSIFEDLSTQGINVQNTYICADQHKLCVDINNLNFEISANNVCGIYETAIIEDINGVIGSSNLFKRSLLLIKSWFFYEGPLVGRTPWAIIEKAMTSECIVVMVMCLFATRDVTSKIESPLQALMVFLHEYSRLDWSKWGITGAGLVPLFSFAIPVPVHSSTTPGGGHSSIGFTNTNPQCSNHFSPVHSSLPGSADLNTFLFPTSSGPISSSNDDFRAAFTEIIGRYRSTLTTGVDLTPQSSSMSCMSGIARSDDQSHADNIMKNFFFSQKPLSPTPSMHSNEHSPTTPPSPSSAQNSTSATGYSSGYSTGTDQRSDHGYFAPSPCSGAVDGSSVHIFDLLYPNKNLIHHANNSPYTHRKVGGFRCDHISAWFQGSFQKLLTSMASTSVSSDVHHMAMSVLPSISYMAGLARSTSEEPVRSPHNLYSRLDLYKIRFIDMLSQVELILFSKVTGEAIANLIVHLLHRNDGKPLTIGEVGKMLKEVVDNEGIQKIIKTHYRGLKRIIASQPHLLRVGDEHTFNPYVYLVSLHQDDIRSNPLFGNGIGVGMNGSVNIVSSSDYRDSSTFQIDRNECANSDGLSVMHSTLRLSSPPIPEGFSVSTTSCFNFTAPGHANGTISGGNYSKTFDASDNCGTDIDSPSHENLLSPHAPNPTFSIMQRSVGAVCESQPIDDLGGSSTGVSPARVPPRMSPDESATPYKGTLSRSLINDGLDTRSPHPSTPFPSLIGMERETGSNSDLLSSSPSEFDISYNTFEFIGDTRVPGQSIDPVISVSPDSRLALLGNDITGYLPSSHIHQHHSFSPDVLNNQVVRPPVFDQHHLQHHSNVVSPQSSSANTKRSPTLDPSSPPLVGIDTKHTAASCATVVDPLTGNKIYNPVKPQVWVPGKFNASTGQPIPTRLGSISHNVPRSKGGHHQVGGQGSKNVTLGKGHHKRNQNHPANINHVRDQSPPYHAFNYSQAHTVGNNSLPMNNGYQVSANGSIYRPDNSSGRLSPSMPHSNNHTDKPLVFTSDFNSTVSSVDVMQLSRGIEKLESARETNRPRTHTEDDHGHLPNFLRDL